MIVSQKKLYHTQELQKRAHDKGIKPRSYATGDKIQLNSKYIKTKCNRKLEAKFFEPFWVLHPVGKQAYKLELSKKWRIHDVFYVSLLEQDNTRKGQVDEKIRQMEINAGNNDSREYEMEKIWDSTVYTRKSESGHLPGLYYLISWKKYLEEENTWEPASVVEHLRKLISSFHKDYPDKPTATSSSIDTASPIARLTVRPTVKPMKPLKQKRGQPTNSTNKQAKKN